MKNKLLIVDTETGGFDPLKCSILSIGALVWEDGVLLDEIEILIAEQPMRTDPEAMRVNKIDLGIHEKMGLTPIRATTMLDTFIRKHFSDQKVPLGGHSVGFDIGFLQRLYRLARKDYEGRFSHRTLDTSGVMQFLKIAGQLPIAVASLDSGLQHFKININHRERHSALADARATARLLTCLVGLVRSKAEHQA